MAIAIDIELETAIANDREKNLRKLRFVFVWFCVGKGCAMGGVKAN